MGIFSRFENKMEDTFEGAADRMANAPISPVQIAKKAEKQMRREKMVGAGKQYAPTLYTVLVNPDDDQRLFGYYPTLAGETETYLEAKAAEQGLTMDGHPLVRFIVDDGLKHGKFEVIAEPVAAPIVAQLRAEEMERYGLAPRSNDGRGAGAQAPRQAGGAGAGGYGMPASDYGAPAGGQGYPQPGMAPAQKPPLPYVPKDEIDYSIDYGEYTFDSRDFQDQDADAAAGGAGAGAPKSTADRAAAWSASAASLGGAAAAGAGAQAADNAVGARVGSVPPIAAADTMLLGAAGAQAAAATRARLVDAATNRSYALSGARVSIGRESRNGVVIEDINVSRTHAELRLDAQGTWTITDLGSTNGTSVNGRPVSSCALSEGDRITLGTSTLVFTCN